MTLKKTDTVLQWTFADIPVGETFSLQRTFSATDVQDFARLSGDYSPLHVDEAYANNTEFGGCVVHGILLAALFSNLIGMKIPGQHALYLGQDISFRKPVRVGETIRAVIRVTSKNSATHTLILATEIRNLNDKVLVGGIAKVKVRDQPTFSQPIVSKVKSQTKQKIVLITGSSRGIGAHIARVLASRGFSIAINYFRSKTQAQQLVEDIRNQGGQAQMYQADVRNLKESEYLLTQIEDQWGGLDCLVNCASGTLQQKPISTLSWGDFLSQLEYQLRAVFQLCQLAHPLFRKQGGGSVVNILSQMTSGSPPANMADYVAAKYALKGFSKNLAVEWASDGIRVNTVSPGLTQTEMTQNFHERVFKMEAGRTPLKRLALPEDTAKAVAFLLSNEAAFLTGVDIPITGGQVMN